MANEMLQRDDISLYAVAGVPKSFKKKLQTFVENESKGDGDTLILDDELTEWVLSKLRGDKRRSHERTPGSSALWRAYRALSAARYHLQDSDQEERIRSLRNEIEELWRETSPIIDDEEDEEFAEDEEKQEVGA